MKKPYLQQRSSGVLLPIFSLPGGHGIGDIGSQAFQFIDFLSKAGQSSWQILPLGPTEPVFANSPYMSPSAFAANPLYISLDQLVQTGLLTDSEIHPPSYSEYSVNYQQAADFKLPLLKLAWKRFSANHSTSPLDDFNNTHRWVKDYSLFKVLREHLRRPWYRWPSPLKRREPEALKEAEDNLEAEIRYSIFEQFLFFSQWNKLRRHAERNNVRIIGDLPIYVALDSSDVWANQEIFRLDKTSGTPTHVAGVPPDYFSATGQLWGNPLYRWQTRNQAVKTLLWDWWEARLHHNFLISDIVRIDHFRGFESYWAVPAKEETAIHGKWMKGPGLPFFNEMKKRISSMEIIAEDLGIITPQVELLRDELGFPGMKILLFAFDGSPDNGYLPHNISPNSVVYTGTHDNDTAVGWYLDPAIPEQDKIQAKRYANQSNPDAGLFARDLIHLAMSTTANLAVIPLQDALGFGSDCRINTPGTTDGNWRWRCAPRFLTEELAQRLKSCTVFFDRLPKPQQEKS